ncbi:MAG: DUF1269 domain-containing protein [Candidatus Velthaea sp.]
MAELVIIAFDNESAAEKLMAEVATLESQYVVQLQDAAVITRSTDGRYNVKPAVNVVGAGLLGGTFWGLLVGFLFLMPFVGAAIGAAGGALSGKLAELGIDQRFIEILADKLPPGKSAAVLIVEKATPDKVLDAIRGYGGTIVQSSLTAEAQARLQAALSSAPAPEAAPASARPPAASAVTYDSAPISDTAPAKT